MSFGFAFSRNSGAFASATQITRLRLPLRVHTGRRGIVAVGTTPPVRRFYESTGVELVGDSWRVLLDGKTVKTPKGAVLEVPSSVLAEAISEEWAEQETHVKPLNMPLTTIGCTAVDIIRAERTECIDRMIPYLATDTLCFEDSNERLAVLQRTEWTPVRQWFETRFGVSLSVVQDFAIPRHPEGTLETVSQELSLRDEWDLCALEIATTTCKSLVVATALLERDDATPEAALRWALLEEHFQIEKWGLVEGEHDVSHVEILRWLSAVRSFSRKRHSLPERTAML